MFLSGICHRLTVGSLEDKSFCIDVLLTLVIENGTTPPQLINSNSTK